MKTSDMEWKVLPIGQLKPAAYNPRKQLKPGDKEYEKIKNSIQEFGYVEPVIVNYDMTVIGGHQRLTVLKELGYEEVQCVVVHIEDEHKVKALNIALNKITGTWNEQLLADLIVDLQSVDFNVDLTGFEAPEVEQLFSKVHNKKVREDDFDVDGELEQPAMAKVRGYLAPGGAPRHLRRCHAAGNLYTIDGRQESQPGADGSSVQCGCGRNGRKNQERQYAGR